ncbi:synaptogenesis protein syg-2-like [Tachypleus tridentatus]|uniref:synaptogenesis protein syg-2-like n=1 Tax=Tachypleus tridentatus TaxID=6853 RepID=UPI003FCF3FCC
MTENTTVTPQDIIINERIFTMLLIDIIKQRDDREIPEETQNVAVVGGKVAIPCDITPSIIGDTVELVLWYKDDFSKPIYSYDGRARTYNEAQHVAIDFLNRRAFFSTVDRPSVLAIYPVVPNDEGSYRCRVDFQLGRTRHFQTYVMVIVPPQSMRITDTRGKILQDRIGPLNEGDPYILTCEVFGGRPSPSVSWWKDNTLLDDSYETTARGTVVNKLVIPELKRYHLMATLTCQSSNNNMSIPLTTLITLDMNLRPTSVRIQDKGKPLSSGKVVELECRTDGSRPPADITWWRGVEPLRSNQNQTDGNWNHSILSFRPSKEDNGKYLFCKAENPEIRNSVMEDILLLDVYYPPEVMLRLGNKLRHSHIEEGNDVYLECNIQANPRVTEISWLFEGQEIQTNVTVGVIISNQSLVLQKVKLASRGHYYCSARNSEGYCKSNVIYLRVQCKYF